MLLSWEVKQQILSYFHREEDEEVSVLSNRRNKGLLAVANKEVVKRRLNLEFFNCGLNDGLPSSLIRECVILGGFIAGHPNVVPLESIEIISDTEIELTYPFYPVSLRQFKVVHYPQIPTALARDLIYQLFRAVAYLESQRVTHRNIRMENILVDTIAGGSITLKLTDFTHATTRGGHILEEKNRNRPQTDREKSRLMYACPTAGTSCCDIWASGVVLLELLGEVPWAQSSSESEYLIRVAEALGSPFQPSLSSNWTLPVFEKPDWVKIANSSFINTCTNLSFWERLRADRGPHALLFIAKVLDPDPKSRCTAQEALESAFLMGMGSCENSTEEMNSSIDWFRSAKGEVEHQKRPLAPLLRLVPTPSSEKAKWSKEARLEWIGSFLIPISRILECQSSRPVHVAVSIFHSLPFSTEPSAALLVACLKVASRFDVSKDVFKQVSYSEISACSDPEICSSDILSSEQFILANMDKLIDCFRSTAWDWVEYLSFGCSLDLVCLAEYIADLALMDAPIADENSLQTIGIACFIVAAQWLGEEERINLVPLELSVSIDALQIAVSRCISLVSERRASIILLNNGATHAILQNLYRNKLPVTVPSVWKTSRTYIESVIGRRREMSTPPKPMKLRLSTLQHAQEWAIESRRKKRGRRSSTPKRPPNSFNN